VLAAATKRRLRHTRTGIELPRADGRTIASRRFRELVESFEQELGGKLSPVEQSLVRQAASLTLAIECMQADVVAGVQIHADAMVRVSSKPFASRCRSSRMSRQRQAWSVVL
jgi:hypothetical protein